jgi:TPP-dependent indolepyruvate ferredoxin oxidoreductase alpha subunit
VQDPPPVQIRPRVAAVGLPAADPACAGCAQLATFRALRRAGLASQGGLGCDPAAAPRLAAAPGRWAAVLAARWVLERGPRDLLAAAAREGAALVVVADDAPERAGALEARLAGEAPRVVRVDLADALRCEEAIRRAALAPGTVALAVAPCARGRAPAAPLEVAPSRCSRCGACLSLACAALSDAGGDAVDIDPRVCSGCGRCAPLCRGGALRPPGRGAATRAA